MPNMPLFKKFLTPTTAAVFISFFILGVVLGFSIDRIRHASCRANYAFINVSEACGRSDVIKKSGYAATKGVLERFVAEEKAAGRANGISVYYRDLENGTVFGIGETADFAPASLLKLPVALVYLTQEERAPDMLNERLSVAEPEWSFSEHYPPSEKINPREPHTVEELLARMLKHSDNDAYGVLQTHLYETGQKNIITKTFLELGFIDPDNVFDEVISVRQYAAIFRALYNVSYLNAELSEKVLGWLAQSEFTQGLAGGVPESVVVAHKFGERFTDDGTKQLHDCGIVYYPGNPYLICVMTRGTDFDALAAVIRRVSQTVYEEVDSRRIR